MRTQFSYRLTHTRPRNTENSSFYVRCTEIKKRSQTEKKILRKTEDKKKKILKKYFMFQEKAKKIEKLF